MTEIRQRYISLIQKRSSENKKAIWLLFSQRLLGNCLSILRQELDSFIRVIYLGRIADPAERERLMNQTLLGEKWKVLTPNNKWKQVTDKDMVEISNELKGYIHYVYKFGCGFVHLSDFHDYETKNPFQKLDYSEQFDITFYLNKYHGFPIDGELNVETITYLIPAIFEKISGNMACYFDAILHEKMIEM